MTLISAMAVTLRHFADFGRFGDTVAAPGRSQLVHLPRLKRKDLWKKVSLESGVVFNFHPVSKEISELSCSHEG